MGVGGGRWRDDAENAPATGTARCALRVAGESQVSGRTMVLTVCPETSGEMAVVRLPTAQRAGENGRV